VKRVRAHRKIPSYRPSSPKTVPLIKVPPIGCPACRTSTAIDIHERNQPFLTLDADLQCLVSLAMAFGLVDYSSAGSSSLDFLCGKLRARQKERPLLVKEDLMHRVRMLPDWLTQIGSISKMESGDTKVASSDCRGGEGYSLDKLYVPNWQHRDLSIICITGELR
jgi:hypothetical protein